jgi:hypothetical protein
MLPLAAGLGNARRPDALTGGRSRVAPTPTHPATPPPPHAAPPGIHAMLKGFMKGELATADWAPVPLVGQMLRVLLRLLQFSHACKAAARQPRDLCSRNPLPGIAPPYTPKPSRQVCAVAAAPAAAPPIPHPSCMPAAQQAADRGLATPPAARARSMHPPSSVAKTSS